MPDAAARAVSPMATRMPLMVSTAVQALCNRASSRLAPVTTRIAFGLSNRPPGSGAVYSPGSGQHQVSASGCRAPIQVEEHGGPTKGEHCEHFIFRGIAFPVTFASVAQS